jgi:glyoxylase-like metal-dependent hydrolase (beta-lactamase superfamily II)
MDLGKGLEALEVSMRFGANESTIYPVLIWDENDGATLIDTGVPGSHVAMIQALPAEQRERVRELFAHPPSVWVDRTLVDGETLPYRGGIVVIHTPGHTPGHISLFITADRLLISGDALRVVDGELMGPSPQATPDLAQATASLRKLLGFSIDRVLCYHGGLSKPAALERLRVLAAAT